MIYQFAHHDRVKPTPPACEAADLHGKLDTNKPLTRQEKDRLTEILYGTFGAHAPTYRLAGWAFSFSEHLPLFLVKQYDDWQEYYAPDKTALRKVISGRIDRIVTGN